MIRLLVFLMFMLCGTGLFYLVFVHQVPKTEEETGLPQPAADVAMEKVHIRQNRGQGLEWEAYADTATYNENTKQSWLSAVKFQIFRTADDPPQATDIHGVANFAFVDDARKRVLLQGKAHIVKDTDTEVRADVIDYYTDDGLVKARGNVEVRDKNSYVQGDTLTYSIGNERAIVTVPKLYQ